MVDVDSREGISSLGARFEAYSREVGVLERKLENLSVPPEKKGRCQHRLHDLKDRLIPRVVRQMQGS